MEFKKVKTIMDSVHGYITIPKSFITNLIDTEYFQRLRNIDQTGMKMLYPNTKHDRFSHSLGVYHLGRKAVKKLIQDIKSNYCYNKEWDVNYYWEKNEICFLIACLLHDIGHAPFSHSLEQLILENSRVTRMREGNQLTGKAAKLKENQITITEQLGEYINFYEKTYAQDYYNEEVIINHGAPHEKTGALMILSNQTLSDKIKTTIQDVFKQEMNISKNELDNIFCEDDLCFIARMIIGLKYTDWHPERQIKNAFIELLNGENFDVDSLDYIVRDTRMSGISNVNLDVERLLNSICVVIKTKHLNKQNLKDKVNAIYDLNIASIKNDGKNSHFVLNGNIRGGIIIKKGTKVLLSSESEFEYIKGLTKDKAKIKYTEVDAFAKFSVETIVMGPRGEIAEDTKNGKKFKQLLVAPWDEVFETYIKNGKLLNNFEFVAEEDLELDLYGYCHIEIDGKFTSKTAISLFGITELDGQIDEVEIIGDTFKSEFTINKESNEKGFHIFSPAFDKKSVNLIANVLDARNYLYLWIYAHHKVVYYANFAIPIIAKEIFKNLNELKKQNPAAFPNWELNYKDLFYIDDFYIWTAMKFVNYKIDKNNKPKKEVMTLINELLTHNYKNSLYKSLAEFDLIFEQFNFIEKQMILENILKKHVAKGKPYIKFENDKTPSSGFLNESFLNDINNLSLMKEHDLQIKELVFVTADYKEKKLKPDRAYIKMNDFATYSQIPLFETQSRNAIQDNKTYFYIYYTLSNSTSAKDNKVIQKALIEVFKLKLKTIKEKKKN